MTRFEYTLVDDDRKIYMPCLPVKISYGGRSVDICGLVDSGAEVNILPYRYGIQLGAEWDTLKSGCPVKGPTGKYETRLLNVEATIPGVVDDDAPIALSFFWSKDESDLICLGQCNFFLRFDVCFYRSAGVFAVQKSQLIPPYEDQ